MATTEQWKDRDGNKQEKTEWHRVVLWAKMAESLSEYLTKGKQVAVVGKLKTREWDDKDGNKRYTTEIRADRIVLLGGGGGGREHPDDPPRQRRRSAAQPAPQDSDFGVGGELDSPIADDMPLDDPLSDEPAPF